MVLGKGDYNIMWSCYIVVMCTHFLIVDYWLSFIDAPKFFCPLGIYFNPVTHGEHNSPFQTILTVIFFHKVEYERALTVHTILCHLYQNTTFIWFCYQVFVCGNLAYRKYAWVLISIRRGDTGMLPLPSNHNFQFIYFLLSWLISHFTVILVHPGLEMLCAQSLTTFFKHHHSLVQLFMSAEGK